MSLYLRLFFRQLRIGLIPALVFLGLIFGLRIFGGFQLFEWRIFDQFLLLRSQENTDKRIVLVIIDEATIQSLGTYPIPDLYLVRLLKRINMNNPRVVGVDIVRDLPVEPGHKELQNLFQTMENLYGIEKVLSPTVAPPQTLPQERTGIADAFLDFDGRQRRVILGTQTPSGDFRFSLSLLLAKAYLGFAE